MILKGASLDHCNLVNSQAFIHHSVNVRRSTCKSTGVCMSVSFLFFSILQFSVSLLSQNKIRADLPKSQPYRTWLTATVQKPSYNNFSQDHFLAASSPSPCKVNFRDWSQTISCAATLRQMFRSNLLSHLVTGYCHQANQSHHWLCNGRHLAWLPVLRQCSKSLARLDWQ